MIINIAAAAAKMPILGGPTVMSGQHTTGRYKSIEPTNKLVPVAKRRFILIPQPL